MHKLLTEFQRAKDIMAALSAENELGERCRDTLFKATMAAENHANALQADILNQMVGLVPQSSLGVQGIMAGMRHATIETAWDDVEAAEAARKRLHAYIDALRRWHEISTGETRPALMIEFEF